MAAADRALTAPRRRLSIAAFAPLPFVSGGRPAAQTGVTIFYAALLPHLAALGHRVSVFAEAPPAVRGESRTALDWPGLTLHPFAFEYWPGRAPLDPGYDRRVGRAVEHLLAAHVADSAPDVVLIGREVIAPAVVDACAPRRLPTVLIAHGVTTAALLRDDHPPRSRQRLLESLRRVDHVIAVAHHLATALADLAVSPVTTIGNIVDPERFRPAPADPALRAALRLPPDAPVIGHVSNLSDHKRAMDLIAAAARLRREAPRAVYLIVGSGSERAALERLVEADGLTANVRFVGEIDHRRMPDHLALCDLVVMPSERETLSLVYRETQACGVVLLASDIAAAREAIADGETGVLFRKGDIGHLAAQILALLRDPARRRRIAASARAVAAAQRPEAWIGAYDAVLQRVARRASGPGAGP